MKDTGFDPFLKPVMRRAAGADTSGIQRVPLAAGSQHEPNGVHALAVVGPRPATAKAMGVHVFGQQRLNLGPQFIGDPVRFFRIHILFPSGALMPLKGYTNETVIRIGS
jgi:hypothetical protein